MSITKSQLWVFAGPNGAGKSTLVAKHHVQQRIPVINPDNIAYQVNPEQRDNVSIIAKAGRVAIEQRRQLLAIHNSFAIETTLTGKNELQLMKKAKELGYKVNLVYVGLKDASQSNTRVGMRVKLGGHDVPEADIFRRFDRSLANLPQAIAISDRVLILDNSGKNHRLLLNMEYGNTKFISSNLPDWFRQSIRLPEKQQQGAVNINHEQERDDDYEIER
ncbi:AAA family ATPase [Stenoxybacter acetivorans]|uniref:AAA family ATPase n=1 Tax=Stenoxybacter acetivorans TaxID=422441 RepID=UPI00068B7789|nr:AAA family ATPase [Stenoxybacter acetivorans]